MTYSRSDISGIFPPMIGIYHAFYLTATDTATGFPATLTPGMFYTVDVHYTDQEVGAAISNTLGLYWWDGVGWSQSGITSFADTVNHAITAQVSHFSLFAVMGNTRLIFMPVVRVK